VLGGVMQRDVMLGVVQTQEMVKEKIKPLPPDQQEKALADIAATLQATMLRAKIRASNTSIDSVYASGRLVALIASSTAIAIQADRNAAGLHRILGCCKRLQEGWLCSACQAFGHRELLGQLRSFGLVITRS